MKRKISRDLRVVEKHQGSKRVTELLPQAWVTANFSLFLRSSCIDISAIQRTVSEIFSRINLIFDEVDEAHEKIGDFRVSFRDKRNASICELGDSQTDSGETGSTQPELIRIEFRWNHGKADTIPAISLF